MISAQALVFDLDGTLVNSLQDIAMSVNAVLVRHGRTPHRLEAYNHLVGWGLKALIASASEHSPFSESESAVVYAELLEDYRKHPVHSQPYEGIVSLLLWAQDRIPLAVFSNKEDGMTRQVVSTLFPMIRFSAVVGARPGVPHKPDPSGLLGILTDLGVSPSRALFLGDSEVDAETSARAGTVFCGATWGFRERAALVNAGAQHLFENAESFQQWLETETKLG